MQLKMPFLVVAEPSPPMPTAGSAPMNPPPTAWDQIDETARIAALDLLARLIARMLANAPSKEAGHE